MSRSSKDQKQNGSGISSAHIYIELVIGLKISDADAPQPAQSDHSKLKAQQSSQEFRVINSENEKFDERFLCNICDV